MTAPPAVGTPLTAAPPLETPRLRLRAHRPDDCVAAAAMWGDPDVVRFLGGHPLGGEDAWRRLLQYAGLWRLLGFGYWAVEETASGRYIGDVGCADFHRGLTPALDGLLEFGWVLARAAHGHGYASEAVAAVGAWTQARFPSRRSVCIIAPDNVRSLRVAEKAGFRRWYDGVYHDAPIIVFSR